jgi:uncharacterized protein involved in propanediol utilization
MSFFSRETSPPAAAQRQRTGTGIAFGTFGELLQGIHAHNNWDFLVTFPIRSFSRAALETDASEEMKVIPSFKCKSVRLARRLLEHYQLPLGGTLTIESDLPVGKGLASSSADLVATARAIESCYDISIPLELLQACMAEIEPSDGVMYPGAAFFYHRKVLLGEMLGAMPPLTVVAIDEGGEVDTIEYNKNRKPFSEEEKEEYTLLYERLKAAFEQQDIRTIGDIATRSVMMNQPRRKNRSLDYMLQLTREHGALGVITAHSGTFIGVLLDRDEKDYEQQLARISALLEQDYGKAHIYYSL